MNEHDSTRYLFAQSIKDLMAKQSLDKMTVTDIVKHSGMTRQTFYRYFKDKYDLVNWYFEKLADKSFRQIGNSSTLREGLIKKFTFLLNDKIFFMQAFQSKDYNNVENYDYQCILEFYQNIIYKKIGNIPTDIMFLLEKHPYNKTLIVKIDNVDVDHLHYNNIDELCEILKKYYSTELLEEKDT